MLSFPKRFQSTKLILFFRSFVLIRQIESLVGEEKMKFLYLLCTVILFDVSIVLIMILWISKQKWKIRQMWNPRPNCIVISDFILYTRYFEYNHIITDERTHFITDTEYVLRLRLHSVDLNWSMCYAFSFQLDCNSIR